MEVSVDGIFQQYVEQKKRADEAEARLKAAETGGISRGEWVRLAFKIASAVGGVIIAACTYLTWRMQRLEPKVDNVEAKTAAQKVMTEDLPARIARIETYLRAQRRELDCQQSQERSAIRHATGYDLTSQPDTSAVHWFSEGTKPNLTYYPSEQCLPAGTSRQSPPGAAPE